MKQKEYVYICSAYRGNVKENVEQARKYSRYAVEAGYIPITPHIYFTQFLDDNNDAERQQAIEMNMQLLMHCKEIWVFGNEISTGMSYEIMKAQEYNIPIVRKRI